MEMNIKHKYYIDLANYTKQEIVSFQTVQLQVNFQIFENRDSIWELIFKSFEKHVYEPEDLPWYLMEVWCKI